MKTISKTVKNRNGVYDVNQLLYSKVQNLPMSMFYYRDYEVKYKHMYIFIKKIIVRACCVNHVMDMHHNKEIISIKEIE